MIKNEKFEWRKDNFAFPLYKQIFFAHDPSLMFLGLPWRVVPFPLFECQAILAASFLLGKAQLPTSEQMLSELKAEIESFKASAGALSMRYFTMYGAK